MGGICGIGIGEGPRQPLSRSLPGGKNPVSVLMEYSQRSGNPIEFIITGQAGPPHDPRYQLLHLFLKLSSSSEGVLRHAACPFVVVHFLLSEAVDQL